MSSISLLWLLMAAQADDVRLNRNFMRAPRMVAVSKLKEFVSIEPFSAKEQTWLLRAERRIGACRDSLLDTAISAPNACLFNKESRSESLKNSRKTEKRPLISVLLSFMNNTNITSLTLTASVLALYGLAHGSEVIVVDDNSTESTTMIEHVRRRLTEKTGIEIISIRTQNGPLGYGMASNLGLIHAKGKYILLLNNDVIVFKSTIVALLETFGCRAGVGAVVPRFVDFEGKVQEAGSVIFADGGAMQLGSSLGLDYNDSLFRYVRATDYGSAACLLIRRDMIDGGFDQIYQPAYYEDTDLSMSLRQDGFHTVYQPFSVALHKGSMTYQKNTLKDSLMARNRRIFANKWGQALECHYSRWVTNWINLPPRQNILRLVTRLSIFRILYIGNKLPCFDSDADSARTINLMRLFLSLGAHVTFVATYIKYNSSCVYQLNWLGVHVIEQKMLGLGARGDVKNTCEYDISFLSGRNSFAKWQRLLSIGCSKIPLVFDNIEFRFLSELRELMTAEGLQYKSNMKFSQNIHRYKKYLYRNGITEHRTSQYRKLLRDFSNEADFLNISTALIIFSPNELVTVRELKALRQLRHDLPVFHIANIYDHGAATGLYQKTQNFKNRKGCLLVCNWTNPADIDALNFFIDDVLPQLARNPRITEDFVLNLVGTGPPPDWINELRDIGGFQVLLHGHAEDLHQILQHVRVVVIPLRESADVKGIIHFAMMHNIPVVATTIATKGVIPDEKVIIADDASDFARRLLDLHVNSEHWNRVSAPVSMPAAKYAIGLLLKYLLSSKAQLKKNFSEGARALQGSSGCDRRYGKYSVGAVVPMERLVNVSGHRLQFEFEEAMTPENFIFAVNSNFLDRIWGISSISTATVRCQTDRACTGFCWHAVESTFFYYNAISKEKLQRIGDLGDYPPGWRCWLHHQRIKSAFLSA